MSGGAGGPGTECSNFIQHLVNKYLFLKHLFKGENLLVRLAV